MYYEKSKNEQSVSEMSKYNSIITILANTIFGSEYAVTVFTDAHHQ